MSLTIERSEESSQNNKGKSKETDNDKTLLIYAEGVEKPNEPLFCMQDKEIFSILEKIEQVQSTSITDSDRISRFFVLILSLI